MKLAKNLGRNKKFSQNYFEMRMINGVVKKREARHPLEGFQHVFSYKTHVHHHEKGMDNRGQIMHVKKEWTCESNHDPWNGLLPLKPVELNEQDLDACHMQPLLHLLTESIDSQSKKVETEQSVNRKE